MKIVASALVLALSTSSALASRQAVTSYDQLSQALKEGNDVKAMVNFDNCQLKSKMALRGPATGAITRFTFNTYSQYKVLDNGKERYAIVVPLNIYTEHRDLGIVLGYGRLRIFEDNSIEVLTSFYDPKSFVLKGTYDYGCHLGKDAGSVSIFAD